MGSILKSTLNTRSILSNNLRFIRSDVPVNLNKEEIQWLVDNNITTIVDLREEKERNQKNCPLSEHDLFQYLCMPVTGGNTVPGSVDKVTASYINMVDSQMDKIIDTLMSSHTNVLYFCNAGKDRTGVVSAILLHKLGMSRQCIIDDYMESGKNLKDMLDAYAKQFPEVNINVITPHPEYIEKFLDWYTTQVY